MKFIGGCSFEWYFKGCALDDATLPALYSGFLQQTLRYLKKTKKDRRLPVPEAVEKHVFSTASRSEPRFHSLEYPPQSGGKRLAGYGPIEFDDACARLSGTLANGFYENCGLPQFSISYALRRGNFFDKLKGQATSLSF